MSLLAASLDATCALLDRARTRYPAPFSVLASELLFELSTPQPEWGRVFLLQIDLFEASVALLSFVQLAELERLARPLSASTEAVTRLRDGTKLSSGHWWALLRETSRDVKGVSDAPLLEPARIATSLYFADDAAAARKSGPPFAKLLDDVPNLRNRVKGHAWTLPQEEYAEYAGKLLDTTAAFLRAIEGLEGCATFVVSGCAAREAGVFEIDARLLDGDARRPLRRSMKCLSAITPGHVMLARRSDLEAALCDPSQFLDLHPFVQLRKGADGVETLFLLQSIEPKQLDLASVAGGARVACTDTVAEAIRRLDGLLARSRERNKPFETLRARARELAVSLLTSPAASASYDARSYLARPRLMQQLEVVEQSAGADGASATRIWLASAPSGSGKTALACHTAERWLNSGRHDEVVVVALASEVLAAGGSLTSWWQQRFGATPAQSCAAVRDAGGSVRLFIDGLDRLSDPDAVVSELADFVTRPETESMRVLATATEAVADDAFDRLRAGRRTRSRTSASMAAPS